MGQSYGELCHGISPVEKLTVNGAVNLGTTTNTNAGTIRWTGSDFEGYDGAILGLVLPAIRDTFNVAESQLGVSRAIIELASTLAARKRAGYSSKPGYR